MNASFESVLSVSVSCEDVLESSNRKEIARECETSSAKKKDESAINLLSKKGISISGNPVLDGNKGKNAILETKGNVKYITIFDGNGFLDFLKSKGIDKKGLSLVLVKGQEIILSTSRFPMDEEISWKFISLRDEEKSKGFETIGRRVNDKKMELFVNPLRYENGIKFRIKK